MTPARATASALPDSLLALGERKRILDAVWLLTLFVTLLGVIVPWYLRILDIDLAPVAWGLFAFATLHAAAGWLGDRAGSRRGLLALATTAHLAGVAFLAVVWHLAGGWQNPMLLGVFVLPVMAAGLLLAPWQPYVTALAAVLAVLAAAFLETPELRWYAMQLGLPVRGLAELLPAGGAGAARPFPTLGAPPAYHALMLGLFSLLLLAAAVVSESLASVVLRLYGRLRRTADAAEQAESLAAAVLKASPQPAALLYADTAQIVSVSDSFSRRLLLAGEDLAGRGLFEAVRFSYPEVVADLLREGGEIPFAVYRVGDERRVARVRVVPLRHADERYAQVTLEDLTELYYLERAVDAVAEPILVIGLDGRLLYHNRSAEKIFGEIYFGLEAQALAGDDLPAGWWDPGGRERAARRIELGGKAWRVRLVAARVPGEAQRLVVATLRLEEAEEAAA